MEKRKIICACDPCALRFADVVGGRFKLIPRDAHVLDDFCLSDGQWEGLNLPINLAFFFHSSSDDQIRALYPSPAGATESLVPLPTWEELATGNPALGQMESDVEALLINRVGERREAYIAPIDSCFELVGLIRAGWRGFSGGDAVWKEIDAFFDRLRSRSRAAAPAGTGAGHA